MGGGGLRIRILVGFDYEFEGEDLSEVKYGDLMDEITKFYNAVKKNYPVREFRVLFKEVEQ